jgi:1,4-alpha-glucan branching enzyme
MGTKVMNQKKKRKRITFSIEALEAKEVFLVGEFNGWKTGAHPMKKNGTGIWTKPLMLPEGRFEYKFLIDNNWVADPQNERSCSNCFGTQNSIVSVNL